MINNQDIRWEQRFSNYRKALSQLKEFIEKGDLNKFEEQGFVKAFEYTYELAWNTLKDFLKYQGFSDIVGSRDTIRTAFSEALIQDGHIWMAMIESRNKTSHTYNETTARDIANDVRDQFYPAFCALEETLSRRCSA